LAGPGSEDPAITIQVCTADAEHDCTDTPAVVGSDIYAYDDNDNRTRVKEFNGAVSSDRYYCYDALDRIAYRNTGAACSSTAKDETYIYDDAGNRTSMTVGGVTTTFVYDDEGRLTSAGGEPITHDSAGRMRSWDVGTPVWNFTYDAEGRLLSACRSSSCASGHDKVEFTYDGEGHRTQIKATAAGGTVTTTDFRYQGDSIVEEKVNGSVARSFVIDEAGSIVKMTIPSGANAGDYLVSWNGHGDALHLLRIKADGTTELANTFTYSTWGAPTVDGTHDNSANGGADYGDLGFRYLYVGEFDVQWDNAFGLGLHYMHARHYAPALGRFLQPDPTGLEDSLYAYAANNPVTEMDPDGTCFIVCIAVGAVVDTALYLATTDSKDWDFGDAVSTVAMGAVESAVNPFAKISKAAKLVSAAGKALSKVPKATRVVQSVTRAVKRATSARNNSVYIAGPASRPSYVGITKNYANRATQHRRVGRTIQPTTVRNVSRFDAHAVEQAMINKHRLQRNGGSLANKVNSVSRRDVLYRVYVWRGNQILRKHGLN
jgi:RHS repeat-associated protein